MKISYDARGLAEPDGRAPEVAKIEGERPDVVITSDWPGLAKTQLYQGRDLAVTTDYRTLFAAILERHLGLADRQLAQIFPGLPPARSNLGELLAASSRNQILITYISMRNVTSHSMQ